MKKGRGFFIGLGFFLLLFILLVGGEDEEFSGSFSDSSGLPEAVLRWQAKIEKEAKANGIPEAVPYLLGIVMVESGGNAEKTPDIFQCSESQGRPPNSIQSPEESIQVGVHYFATLWNSHRDTDILNVVQAYNYGGGFLSFAGKTYSFDKAVAFSKDKANGQQVPYDNPIASELGYHYRYNYGNMFYVALVKQYLVTDNGGNSGNSSIVQSALRELKEGNHAGGDKYWRWYGFSGRVEWCAIFVSYNADKAHAKMERFAYCPAGIDYFKAHHQWKNRGTTPKSGNIIFFDWDSDGISDHVGIVEKVVKGKVITIEGNSGDQVAEQSYSKNSPFIAGYGTL